MRLLRTSSARYAGPDSHAVIQDGGREFTASLIKIFLAYMTAIKVGIAPGRLVARGAVNV